MSARSNLSIWHPFTHAALDPSPIKIERAQGVYLYAADGQRYLDAISSWWVNLHGHGHPRIAAAVAEQARKLEHVIFAGFTHEAAEELAEGLRAVAPQPLRHIFFSDNGSTAVEVALKMAIQYWQNVGKPEKKRLVALEHAYHGDTVGAMSLSADSAFTAAFSGLRFPVWRSHSAYCYRCPVGKTRATCDIECLERLARFLDENGRKIAALIIEPLLQGAGGMIVHPTEFVLRTRKLCAQYDVLMIADEVLTGFGRCGTLFACGRAGVAPDLMCLSKGLTGGFLPLGATLCTDAVHEAFTGPDRQRTFFHGHSYSGNPLGCAAAVANLQVFESEPVFGRITALENIHRQQLPPLKQHPAVGDVRMVGTVAAVELKARDPGYLCELRPKLYDFYLKKGVLLRPLGNVVYILPPYVMTREELLYVYEVIGESLELVRPAGRSARARS